MYRFHYKMNLLTESQEFARFPRKYSVPDHSDICTLCGRI
jgi:hypothetical protein